MIKNATFTSVWDGGYEVTTNCKVDMETREVFDIEISENTAEFIYELDYEYITIDGDDYSVHNAEDGLDGLSDNVFWYE